MFELRKGRVIGVRIIEIRLHERIEKRKGNG